MFPREVSNTTSQTDRLTSQSGACGVCVGMQNVMFTLKCFLSLSLSLPFSPSLGSITKFTCLHRQTLQRIERERERERRLHLDYDSVVWCICHPQSTCHRIRKNSKLRKKRGREREFCVDVLCTRERERESASSARTRRGRKKARASRTERGSLSLCRNGTK